jgi:hypothetical protein
VKRLLTVAALTLAVFWGRASFADEPGAGGEEPPIRLKKKTKPSSVPESKPSPAQSKDGAKQPGPPKAMDPQDDPELPAADEPEVDEEEMLNRIAKNMRSAEARLANKELGEETKQVQRDILKDLDRLIDQNPQSSQNPSSNSINKTSSDSKSDKNSKGQQPGQSRKQARKRDGKQMAGKHQGAKPQQETGQQPGGKQNGGGGGKTEAEGGPDKLADSYKDIWGHLPETLRAEMNAYASREEFMAKYRDLLKQYYTTIAEKGQRKGG